VNRERERERGRNRKKQEEEEGEEGKEEGKRRRERSGASGAVGNWGVETGRCAGQGRGVPGQGDNGWADKHHSRSQHLTCRCPSALVELLGG
jgi:hypothetical protein